MNISIELDRDFERFLEAMKEKYGEHMLELNGLSEKQLNHTAFIDNFIDKQSYIDIATHLKRTVIAVEGMASKLKLKLTERKEKPNKWLEATLIRMQELIKVCETADNLYIKDKAKEELYTLSFKRSSWGVHKMPYKYRKY